MLQMACRELNLKSMPGWMAGEGGISESGAHKERGPGGRRPNDAKEFGEAAPLQIVT